jgi:hypothetical protein
MQCSADVTPPRPVFAAAALPLPCAAAAAAPPPPPLPHRRRRRCARFVVGYCIDYDEKYRDMSHLCVVSDEGIERFRSKSLEEEWKQQEAEKAAKAAAAAPAGAAT